MASDPQAPAERRLAARHLVQNPLTAKEHDPDTFRLIRRHEADLDRWFTQRLGYRLHVDADSARLFKTGVVPENRPLRTASTGRPFHQREYVLLALVLASTAAGPAVISLRDLVDKVRSAAAEADLDLSDTATERRALVTVVQWMIARGLATELHARVEGFATDETVDAVLKVRPDRIALLPLPALVDATTSDELLARADRRDVASRQWMRGRLVEDPVLYRDDLTDEQWGELRRRLSDEERILGEMFGLTLESRAEGVAAVDPDGTLADTRFPTGGTLGHAALLLLHALHPDHLHQPAQDRGADLDRQADQDRGADQDTATPDQHQRAASLVPLAEVRAQLRVLVAEHGRHWAADLVASPDRLERQVLELLVDLRLAERVAATDLRLLPAAGRFLPALPEPLDGKGSDGESAARVIEDQTALW